MAAKQAEPEGSPRGSKQRSRAAVRPTPPGHTARARPRARCGAAGSQRGPQQQPFLHGRWRLWERGQGVRTLWWRVIRLRQDARRGAAAPRTLSGGGGGGGGGGGHRARSEPRSSRDDFATDNGTTMRVGGGRGHRSRSRGTKRAVGRRLFTFRAARRVCRRPTGPRGWRCRPAGRARWRRSCAARGA